MERILIEILAVWAPLVYAAIFFGMVFEGELFLFVATFMGHQGLLNLPLVLVIAGIGFLLGDFLWFFAGKHLLNKIPFLERMSHKVVGVFDKHFEDRPFLTIFASKFAYGIHRAIMLRAGQQLSTKVFARCVIISDVIWFSLVVGCSLGLSTWIGQVKHFFRLGGILLLLAILAFLFFEHIVAFVTERMLKD